MSPDPCDLLIYVAMEAEAAPIAAIFGCLGPPVPLAPPLPARIRSGLFRGVSLHLVTAGAEPRFGVDAIGTQPAAVTVWAACERFRPRLIINAGTAGGFATAGAAVGDVYISDGPVVFHDRRVPLGAFESAGIGSYPSVDCRSVAARLGLKLGRLSTGDSLDLSEADARQMEASGATVKDMEGAAVAWVASIWAIPFVGLKAITDLVDGPHPTAEAFVANLDAAVRRLTAVIPEVVSALAGAFRG